METIFTNIKERVLYISEYKGIGKEKFFKELDVTYGNFKGKAKGKALSSDVLATIVSKYADISPAWLLTGNGEMIIKEKPCYPNHLAGKPDKPEDPFNKLLIEKRIESQRSKETIELLKDHIAVLKENTHFLKTKVIRLEGVINKYKNPDVNQKVLKIAEKETTYELNKDKTL